MIFILLLGTPAFAQPKAIPVGASTSGNVNFASPIQYDEMIKILDDIEKTSKGVVEVFTLDDYGKSEGNRSLYMTKTGTGPIKIWVQAGIHGDEQLTTEAVLEMLKILGSNQSKEIQTILDNVTLYAIPIYNVDGRELNIRGTNIINEQGEVTKENIDLNRDWKVNLKGEGLGFVADESTAYYKYWCKVRPDFALDMHHQGIKQMYDSNESVSFSLGVSLAPNGPTLPRLEEGYYNDITRQMHGYVYDALHNYGYTHIDRYHVNQNEIDIYGGVASAMMLGINYNHLNPDHYSCPAVFFETKGNTREGILGQKSNGYLAKQNYLALKAFLYGIATGEVKEVDPQHWEDIPHHPVKGYYTDYIEKPSIE